MEHGFCFWVIEHEGAFAGWCGVKPGKWPIEGDLEIGWTLARSLWGRGFAQEAATAALGWTWDNTDTVQVLAITAATNHRSRALMTRLGMIYQEGRDFEHSDLPAGNSLRDHVVYRIGRPA